MASFLVVGQPEPFHTVFAGQRVELFGPGAGLAVGDLLAAVEALFSVSGGNEVPGADIAGDIGVGFCQCESEGSWCGIRGAFGAGGYFVAA